MGFLLNQIVDALSNLPAFGNENVCFAVEEFKGFILTACAWMLDFAILY